MRTAATIIGFLLAAAPALASAQSATAPEPETVVVAELMRVCVDTNRDPAAISALASSEGWTPATEGVPFKTGVTLQGGPPVTPVGTWKYERAGQTLFVRSWDIPSFGKSPADRECDLGVVGLDKAKMDAALAMVERIKPASTDSFIPQMKVYAVPSINAHMTYLVSAGKNGPLHLFVVSCSGMMGPRCAL